MNDGTKISSERWKQIRKILEIASELEGERLEHFLDEACGQDTELRSEVSAFLTLDTFHNEMLEQDAFSSFESENEFKELIGEKIDDYTIHEKIGEGGMGTVFYAKREGVDYTQKVALKLIKRGMDTNAVLRRFLTERQILATLEHPNIARFLDGGSTADGLPYFVMEYIEGEPLIEYCNRKNLTIEERLELFRKVCTAVSYAHQKLIVHRDIKPSNIIINKAGEPKLLDFGIGKIISPDWNASTAEATRTSMRLMTPEYASPEQIRGQITTTSTDVYSLGIILYELLTGTRPFKIDKSNPFEISERILTEEPVPPSAAISDFNFQISASENETSELKELSAKNEGRRTKENNRKLQIVSRKSLKGDLDNIILKAIRKETERRYASVQEFADDIERYLQGLPVNATADSKSYRFKKFFQRNQVTVLTASAFVLLLMTATAITGWQYYKAQKAQTQAEQRFNDVRGLARSVIFELHDSIEKLQGSTATRELLVSRALKYLDKLAVEKSDDVGLLEELADAYERIGDIQGNLRGASLGKKDKAFVSYQKALAIRENLLKLKPESKAIKEKLALSYDKLGDIYWSQGKLPETLEMYGKSLKLSEEFFAESPNDRKIKLDLAHKLSGYGFVVAASDKADEGLISMNRAVKLLEELRDEYPNDAEVLNRLAVGYGNVAVTLDKMKQQFSESSRIYQLALNVAEKLHKEDPANKAYKRNLAISYSENAELFGKLRKKELALETSEKGLNLIREISGSDPSDGDSKLLTAESERQYAGFLIDNGKPLEALALLEKALKTFENLKKESPSDEVLKFRIAGVYENFGRANAAIAAKQNSLQIWRKARGYFEESYKIYKYFKDAGITHGLDAAKTDEMAKEIEKCDAVLRR